MEEKQGIVKKLHICITCLCKPEKDHQCPVGRCSKCYGQHNIVLCNKIGEESAMAAQEQSDSSGDDSEEDANDDYAKNRDNVNIARGRTEEKKGKVSSKEGEKGKGESEAGEIPTPRTESSLEKTTEEV
jgi:hypothetical protein